MTENTVTPFEPCDCPELRSLIEGLQEKLERIEGVFDLGLDDDNLSEFEHLVLRVEYLEMEALKTRYMLSEIARKVGIDVEKAWNKARKMAQLDVLKVKKTLMESDLASTPIEACPSVLAERIQEGIDTLNAEIDALAAEMEDEGPV